MFQSKINHHFSLLKEPMPVGKVPGIRTSKPKFYSANRTSISTFPVLKGNNLKGTGEYAGSLIRNGIKVS